MKIPRHEQLNSKFVACGTYLGILIVVSEKSVCKLLFASYYFAFRPLPVLKGLLIFAFCNF